MFCHDTKALAFGGQKHMRVFRVYQAECSTPSALCTLYTCRLTLVAEEDSQDLRASGGTPMLSSIAALVNEAIGETFPGSSHLSNSDVLSLIDLGDSKAGPDGLHWVLDPIDGTRGFANGRQYAVCLGMLQHGQLQLGVLGCPNLPFAGPFTDADGMPNARAGQARDGIGSLFLAAKGSGAFTQALMSDGVLDFPFNQVMCSSVAVSQIWQHSALHVVLSQICSIFLVKAQVM
jgi:3'-phosphoadenosine 5'-phosphosulfate (PAPS) 3'-phosphatase